MVAQEWAFSLLIIARLLLILIHFPVGPPRVSLARTKSALVRRLSATTFACATSFLRRLDTALEPLGHLCPVRFQNLLILADVEVLAQRVVNSHVRNTTHLKSYLGQRVDDLEVLGTRAATVPALGGPTHELRRAANSLPPLSSHSWLPRSWILSWYSSHYVLVLLSCWNLPSCRVGWAPTCWWPVSCPSTLPCSKGCPLFSVWRRPYAGS